LTAGELPASALQGCGVSTPWVSSEGIEGILGGALMGTAYKSVLAGRRSFVPQAAREPWRTVLALAVVAVFAGCAPTRTGATLDALSAPKPGLARIFVLRDKAYPGIFDTGWQAYLDETPMGDLKTGTFVYLDRTAGPHRLYFARPGELYRASQQEISVLSGRTYYFRLHMNEKGQWIATSNAAAGLTGALLASAISAAADERGLFDFTPLDDAAAKAAMAELRLAE
jgi:hypothetical protein